MDLRDATVLVTGATRGVGAALTRRLLAEGAHVIALARDADRLAEAARDAAGRLTPWPLDLGRREDVDAAVATLPSRHPELSVVINNAGVQVASDFVRGEAAARLGDLRAEMTINLEAVVALCAGLLPHLASRPRAAIVNVTSGLALAPKRSAPVYCATKAGVRAFTRALRYQCEDAAPHVHVAEAVLPLVDTDMTRGRGAGKLSPDAAAFGLLEGLKAGRREIYVGKAAALPPLLRLAPGLAYRLLRDD